MSDDPHRPAELTGDERTRLVERQATCPFIGSAVAQGKLPVRNHANDPLASIEDVRRLGNTGGGDLGEVLVLFASGNHAFMLGVSGKLDTPVPSGLFSLELPGSQGSHPGHSGILQGDPLTPGSGRLSQADFARLTSRARDGWIARSDVGRFIAENLVRDPKSKVDEKHIVGLLTGDAAELLGTAGSALKDRVFRSGDEARTTHRDIETRITKLMGEDNLVGSSGEFGLLFAFLDNRPDAQKVGDEPAVSVTDLTAMFVDKRLPDGWETWKKSRSDWVRHTVGLLTSAFQEYRRLKRAN
ncbi:MAG TPA: hypothetical protein VK548_23125 [Candidatus Acidoferrum sp.]|nr:hypothetical protein [Candidatus Acidoferrum sp.]